MMQIRIDVPTLLRYLRDGTTIVAPGGKRETIVSRAPRVILGITSVEYYDETDELVLIVDEPGVADDTYYITSRRKTGEAGND